jgi:hypothetical protein
VGRSALLEERAGLPGVRSLISRLTAYFLSYRSSPAIFLTTPAKM